MKITKSNFGVTADGQQAHKFRLENSKGNYAVVSDYGCTILEVWIADKDGHLRDVVLGYRTLEEYMQNDEYLGACVGRFGGFIKDGLIRLNGQTYRLHIREGEKHHLHGGKKGFDKYVWDSRISYFPAERACVSFSRLSPDGEEHYPGNLKACVSYEFTEYDALKITYDAICDQDTICNLTNHAYFNLEGEDAGSIRSHHLQMDADSIQAVNEDGISDLGMFCAEGTPFDFRAGKTIGQDADKLHIQLLHGEGYDHNYYLGAPGQWKRAATLFSEKSGIEMQVYTTQTGVQFYTANSMDGSIIGRSGTHYHPYDAVCFETQYCAPKEMLEAGEQYPVLKKGERYHCETVYRFAVRD